MVVGAPSMSNMGPELLFLATNDMGDTPLFYHDNMTRKTKVWMTRYRIGPPYGSILPGLEASLHISVN